MKNIFNEDYSPDFLTIVHDRIQPCRTVINDSPELAIVFKQILYKEIDKILCDIVVSMEKLTTSTIEKIERNQNVG